MNTNITDGIGK